MAGRRRRGRLTALAWRFDARAATHCPTLLHSSMVASRQPRAASSAVAISSHRCLASGAPSAPSAPAAAAAPPPPLRFLALCVPPFSSAAGLTARRSAIKSASTPPASASASAAARRSAALPPHSGDAAAAGHRAAHA